MVGHLSVADSQIVYYKQLRGGQMEVTRYTDDSRRSVLQKHQLKQHHMSITSTSILCKLHRNCNLYFSFLFTSGYC